MNAMIKGLVDVRDWIDARFPLSAFWESQMTGY